MKKGLSTTLSILLMGMFLFDACKSRDNNSIATDSLSIALGKTIFTRNCSSCHNFRQDGIGPKLGGLTTLVTSDWIKHFIKDPKSTIESGDERSKRLFDQFHAVMPSFASLTDEEMDRLIAYLNTQKGGDQKTAKTDPNALTNPIPERIPLSGLVVGLEPVIQIPHSSEKLPFTRGAKFDFQPNTDSLFVLDHNGILYKLQHNRPIPYLDMPRQKPAFISQPGLGTGFGSFAFHPEFAKNGLLYTTHTEAANTKKADFKYDDSIKVQLQWVLTEWKTDHPGLEAFSGKSRELLRINMVSGVHGVQEITFNPLAKPGDEDYGQLYIGVGDGGSVENGYTFLTHRLDRVWGTILRIDPMGKNSTNGQYGISPHNPFSKDTSANTVREIYAYGFRNPHRITWSKSGKMLASNIGQQHIESLNIILPGHDYGWPVREGTFLLNPEGNLNNVYPLPANDSIYHITYPVAQYDHDEGNSISGGFEYWGSAVPELKGKYLFGDIANGRLFYVNMADLKLGRQAQIKEWQVSLNGRKTTLRELCGSPRVELRFGRDHRGELYLFAKADGKVYRLTKAAQ